MIIIGRVDFCIFEELHGNTGLGDLMHRKELDEGYSFYA